MLPHSPPTAQPTMRPSDGPKPLSNKVPKTPQKSSPSNPWVAQTPLLENTPPVRSPPLPAAPSIFPPSRPWWPNWPPLLIPSQKPIDADTAGGGNKHKPKVGGGSRGAGANADTTLVQLWDQKETPQGTSKCSNCNLFVYHRPEKCFKLEANKGKRYPL